MLRIRNDFAAVALRLLADMAPQASLSAAAAAILGRRPWPGNGRELRSALVRLTLADPSRVIGADAVRAPDDAVTDLAAPHSLRALLTERVRRVHGELDGNVTEAARQLGVSRNTVYRALRSLDPGKPATTL